MNAVSDSTHPDEFLLAHKEYHLHKTKRPDSLRKSDFEVYKQATIDTFMDASNPLVQGGSRVAMGAWLGVTIGGCYYGAQDHLRYKNHFNEQGLKAFQKSDGFRFHRYIGRQLGKFAAGGAAMSLFHWGYHDKTLEPIFGTYISLPLAGASYFTAFQMARHGFHLIRFYAAAGAVLGSLLAHYRFYCERPITPGRKFFLPGIDAAEREESVQRMDKISRSIQAKTLADVQNWQRI